MSESKRFLHEYVNTITDEQADRVLAFLNACGGMDELKEFSQVLGIDLYNVDFARPQSWSDKMRTEMQVNPIGFVWSYQKTFGVRGESNVWGEPVNLPLEILKRIIENVKGVM